MQCLRPIAMWIKGKTLNGKDKLSPKAPLFLGRDPDIMVPCGKCEACLENRRREWCNRLSIHLLSNPKASFITLTYNDKHLPKDGLCSKRHVQLFLKRFRNLGRDNGFSMPVVKYFICSEYGAKKHRPHYHGILFGVDLFESVWRTSVATLRDDGYPVYTSSFLASAWSYGFVSVDKVTPQSIRYVSKYITKQGSCSDGTWSLKSMSLGKDYFVKDCELTAAARQCAELGFMVLEGKHNPFKIGVPKFLKRYLEKYDVSLYDLVRERARDFVVHSVITTAPSLRQSVILSQWQRENQKRKYDNEN